MKKAFSRLATFIANQSGRPITFLLATVSIIIWALTGPLFHYSDTWQLVINTGTTIITFLMVFIIQNTQNRDGAAIQAKLDELIRSNRAAQNSFIVPPGVAHAFGNSGSAPGRMLLITAPPGHEKYFDELRDLIAKGGKPDPDALAKLRAKYDTVQLATLTPS